MNLRPIALLTLVFLVGGAGSTIARSPAQKDRVASPRPNILLLVADTLRADRLSARGNAESLTPKLDKLASHSFVFHNAYTTSPWTMPAVASLFTSRLPSQHGVNTFGGVLDRNEQTLAEVLNRQGYLTMALATNSLLKKKAGFHQGFVVFQPAKLAPGPRFHRLHPRAGPTNQKFLKWASSAKGRRPFFAYVHYMEPHTPYAAHDFALERTFGAVEPDLEALTQAYVGGKAERPTPETQRNIERAYDAAVITLDHEVGRLLRRMFEKGLWSNTIVVFTADHGDEFGDHGKVGHGHSLYDELVRVPLLIHLPGQSKRVDVETAVSILDLAPTLTELAGAPETHSFEGNSLATELESALAPQTGSDRWAGLTERPQVAELLSTSVGMRSRHRRAVMFDGYKLILGTDGSRELYHTDRDPRETIDAKGAEEARVRLEQVLANFGPWPEHDSEGEPDGPSPERALDDETKDNLRALGYLLDE